MTKVLITFQHRPMCVGLFYRRAFEQLGCEVISAGPSTNEVYGESNWQEFRAPDVELPCEPIAVTDVLDRVAAAKDGWAPDVLVEVDQYDFLVLVGKTDRVKWAHIAVENFNGEQYQRSLMRQCDAEYFMIQHDDNGRTQPPPLPQGAEWMVFGADVDIHPLFKPPAERARWVCQIGSPYEPRPSIWNALRARFDQGPPVPDSGYARGLFETQRTSFGRAFSYEGMAQAYNDAICAISSSNVDFIPMRAAEAFAMGCVLLSDDVPSMRAAFGVPWPENPQGIWATHERSAESIGNVVEAFATTQRQDAIAIAERAYARVMDKHLYRHEAARILKRLGV